MKQKNVILFMPSIEGGGVEKNLFIVANFLVKKLGKLSVITTSKNYRKKFHNKVNLIAPELNFWNKSRRRIKYFICLILLFLEFKKNKNIIVFCFQANIYCILLCKLLGIKILIRSNSSPSGWSKNLLKRFIYKNVLGLADKIMVNSLKFKKQLKSQFNLKAKCIYNPLNINEIHKLSKKKIKENFFNSKNLKILNIGRFTDQKDHITLLKAVNFLKNKVKLKLIIIGGGKNKEKIKKYILENNLTKIIKIKNFIKNPFPYIKKADLFILTSLYEGLPNVILESLALNKFVISSNCPTGPSEILDNNKGGLLFKTSDHIDLAKKISFFETNKHKCLKKVKYAKSRLHRFDYNKNLNIYYNFLKSELT
tara:strand:- start:872 stop:1972 length:1101 start_codon:yes stop_codon:yes gene_type:complete